VQQQIRNATFLVATVAAVAALPSTRADALAFKDIAGKWCTAGGTEQFDRENLIAIPSSNGERRVHPIVSYDFKESTITVIWKDNQGKTVETSFGEFSANGRQMVQLPTEAGPRREFRRCEP
jgi:hypothetical protein